MSTTISYYSSPKEISLISKRISSTYGTYLISNSDSIQLLCKTSDEKFLIAGDLSGTICIYNIKKNYLKAKLKNHEKQLSKLIFTSKEDFLISAGYDSRICVWDFKAKALKFALHIPVRFDSYLKLFKNDKFLALIGDLHQVVICNLSNQSVEKIFNLNGAALSGLEIICDTKIIFANGDSVFAMIWRNKKESVNYLLFKAI
jgi:WD40 repeat protein